MTATSEQKNDGARQNPPKYRYVSNFMSKDEIEYLSYIAVKTLLDNKHVRFGDNTVKNAYQISNTPTLDYLLFSKLKEVRDIFCNPGIIPYYAYCRYYLKDTELTRHKDNAALRYTVTVNLFQTHPYQIMITDPDTGRNLAFTQLPGDALAIEGTEVTHWRDPYEGCLYVQVFLHYMDADSPYADKAIRLRDYGKDVDFLKTTIESMVEREKLEGDKKVDRVRILRRSEDTEYQGCKRLLYKI